MIIKNIVRKHPRGYLKGLHILVFFVMILFLYNFVKNNAFDISAIKNMAADQFLFLVGLVIITLILLGLKTKIIVSHLNVKLSKKEWMGLGVINTFWNYLFLKGGVVARAIYLKKKGLPYSDFSSVIISVHLISLMLFSFLSLIVFVFTSFYLKISLFGIIAFFLAVFAITLLIFKNPVKTDNKILKIFIENHENIKKNKSLIIKLLLLEFAIIIIYSLRLKIVGGFFNYDLPFIIYFLMALFSNVSMNILNLIPGGLGVKEAGSGFILKLFNFNPGDGVAITLIDRMIALLLIVPLGILFNLILFKTISYKKLEKQKTG